MPIEWPDLLIFTGAALTLNLTPGNDMMFVLGQALRGGAHTGFAASLGIATGSAIHASLVAAGVAVVLAQHPAVFDAIRYAGAAYLIWVAYRSLAGASLALDATQRSRTPFEAWRDGTLVNLLNPKIIVFMFAFLPPFVRPENGMPLLQLFILATIFNAGGTLINFAVSAFAGSLADSLTRDRRKARWFARLSAALFALLAVRMIFERR
jgi:threonine/homoserine/homoserine lactone efflux protein